MKYKIGVYVGSFNPVHKGHMKIVNHLIENGYVDKVLIIPTGNYWDKQNLVDIKHRINMLKNYENNFISIDDKLNYLTYTYEILEELTKNSKDEYYLILGADNLINFNRWKNFNYLINFNLVIINRNSVDVKSYLEKYNIKKYTVVNDLPLLDISSTKVRSLVKEKKYKELSKYVHKNVVKYIKKNNLY